MPTTVATTATRVATAVAAVLLVVVAVAAWRHHHDRGNAYAGPGDGSFADYCQEVADQRALIARAIDEGAATTGLIRALPSFQALQEKSPPDIADDWDVVVAAVTDLVDTLRAAGVDPSSYDRRHPPAGLTAEQRGEIDAAATRLGSEQTLAAIAAVQQEARDVCHSPLTL